ncbi:MFS transporter, DHA1 family, multidrug resistance protein [Paenibacillaceae bacterium GAS479]|nr:MFS transporter, DHA1 family, multidrug resistance protein [Paenibacillaceae bacterium GAS479]
MDKWKRNLTILCIGQFLAMASMSCVTPFLPLYLQDLGVSDPDDAALWSGAIYGANLLSAFLFAPLWGRLADRYGRKPMLLRSGIGMAITITLMGIVTSPLQLLLLRLINGVVSGFSPAAVALTAMNAPKERSGYALGMLHSSSVGGTICGPLIGGILADRFGFSAVFLYTGLSIAAASLVVLFWVKETPVERKAAKETAGMREDFKHIMARRPLPSLFVSSLLLRSAMVGSLPLIPLYVGMLAPSQNHIVLLAGVTAASMGVASMLAAPQLGKLGDRFGAHRIFSFSMLGAILFAVPQAFVQNLWQLIALRFFTGAFMGGLGPSLNTIIKQHAPSGMESRTYSYHNSAQIMGGLVGSIGMGAIAASSLGMEAVFLGTAILLLLNWIWMKRMVFRHVDNRVEADKSLVNSKSEVQG